MNKILFFDIDGTLISDRTYKIPPSAIDAISKAKKNGHLCFLCTGRSYAMTKEVSTAGIDNAIITNGMGIILNKQPIILHTIDKLIVSKTLQLIEEMNGGYQIIDWQYGYQNAYNYAHSKKAFLDRFPDIDPLYFFNQKGMKSLTEYPESDILKIDVTLNSEEDAKRFNQELDPSLEMTWAGGYTNHTANAGELVSKGYNKGTGIKELINYLHMDIKDTIAFGDSSNDKEMLKTVNTAIVMGNGSDDIKQYADFITDDIDNDGLAKAMEHLNLI
ncbi:HAD family hydrolase [Eggerthia catenaformis]|uniref:HAD family hydrolase n=1 Tax=Eggerthia catenaformis TaxID=31973 RepID=UPI00248E82CE|nr:HAD family hydrolase [Eggerthia catenaformis]